MTIKEAYDKAFADCLRLFGFKSLERALENSTQIRNGYNPPKEEEDKKKTPSL